MVNLKSTSPTQNNGTWQALRTRKSKDLLKNSEGGRYEKNGRIFTSITLSYSLQK